MASKIASILCVLFVSLSVLTTARACRLNSELLKGYARKTVDKILVPEELEAIYWPDEPLPFHSLSKALGLNVTLVETHYDVAPSHNNGHHTGRNNEVGGADRQRRAARSARASLIQDIFVTCSIDRDRSYALSINLEIENPFKSLDVYYEAPLKKQQQDGIGDNNHEETHSAPGRSVGLFRIHLPQSSLLVQLSQRIKYDDCLHVNYVQLSPSVSYEVECVACDKSEREVLDKIFSKRMSQLDAELDAVLSEKVLFGLQVLLSQERLDLDLYLD